MRLDGERALVTGSTAGIGAAIAGRFAAEGASVCITGRNESRGASMVAEIVAAGGTAAFVPTALDDAGACDTLVAEAFRALGGLTVLVNNAAAAAHGDGPAASLGDDVWDAAFLLNATVPFRLCRAAIPYMLEA